MGNALATPLKNAFRPIAVLILTFTIEKGPIARIFRNWNFPFLYLKESLLFWLDFIRYRRIEGAEKFRPEDLSPVYFQRNAAVTVDPHYFHAHIWALSHLNKLNPADHVDVSSSYGFVGMASVLTKIRYIEFNPPKITTENVELLKGDISKLPLKDGEVYSLSCIHAAEHVGLGRYGDHLDPLGTKKAAAELERVLAPGGTLLFALPIGRQRVQFNGQRIHSGGQIAEYFSGLVLKEYSGINDEGRFLENIPLDSLDQSYCGCGLFMFRKTTTEEQPSRPLGTTSTP